MALSAFLERLGDVPISRDPAEIRRKSKDYFWFSPVLAEELQHLEAEVIVTPRDRADLLRVVEKLNLPIIEDNVYGFLDNEPPLAALARQTAA